MLSRRIVPRGSPLSPFAPCARAQFLVAVHVFELCSEPPAPALPGAADDDDADDGASDALSAAEAISVARAVRVRFVCPFLRRIVLDTFPAATREQMGLMLRRAIAAPAGAGSAVWGRIGQAESVGGLTVDEGDESDADGAGEPGADRAASSGFFGCALPGVN